MPCRLLASPDFVTSPWLPTYFSPGKMLPTFDYYFVHSAPPGHDPWRGYHNMFEPLAVSGTWSVFRKRPGPVVPDWQPPPSAALPVPAAPTVVPKALPPAAASGRLGKPSVRPSTKENPWRDIEGSKP
jgi:hypothetical protein